MHPDILIYNASQSPEDQAICDLLEHEISAALPNAESKVWHRHPVWFLDGNPIVGYLKLKAGIRLMFWSGMSFEEEQLEPGTGKFQTASVTYANIDEVDKTALHRWLEKSESIQWDYKNLIKRKGQLLPLKGINYIYSYLFFISHAFPTLNRRTPRMYGARSALRFSTVFRHAGAVF